MYQQLLSRKHKLDQQIQQTEALLALSPPGHLICTRNGIYTKHIHVSQGVKTHIPKQQSDFAKKLAKKKYLTALLEDLQHERTAILSCLKQYESHSSSVEQLLNHPAYRSIILSALNTSSPELTEWEDAAYETNPANPSQRRHPCASGHIVRSKSEVLIDQALFFQRIPFRYECALSLGEVTFYPDFTIRHPKSGQFFYWEHFGLMDSPSYSQNAFQKLQIYSSNGYIPTINLITTFETREYPLCTDTIDRIIEQYFL
ncbi:MAG: ATPase [Clostridium sp.]|nr:ATPase [Clostridium sp.]